MRQVFDHPVSRRDGGNRLLHLRQGRLRVVDYSVEFRSLAIECGCYVEALISAFLNEISDSVKDELAAQEGIQDLEMLISRAIRVDNRFRERNLQRQGVRNEDSSFGPGSTYPTAFGDFLGVAPEAMALGRTCISATEREALQRAPLYLLRRFWPLQRSVFQEDRKRPGLSGVGGVWMSQVVISITQHSQLSLSGTISWGSCTVSVSAFVDSGSAGNLIDEDCAHLQGIPLLKLERTYPVTSLDGQQLGSGTLSLATIPLNLRFDQHREVIQLTVTKSPHLPVILGYPWLSTHDPRFNWTLGVLEDWGAHCHSAYLLSPSHPPGPEPIDIPDLAGVPVEYHNLAAVFSKQRSSVLPPHRDLDCAIDLLPGTTPPQGKIYSLSVPEHEGVYPASSRCRFHSSIYLSRRGGIFLCFQKDDHRLAPMCGLPRTKQSRGKESVPSPLHVRDF